RFSEGGATHGQYSFFAEPGGLYSQPDHRWISGANTSICKKTSSNICCMIRRIHIPTKLWVLADQAVVSGSAFATNILIAHALRISDFGTFSVLILVQLFLLGVQ